MEILDGVILGFGQVLAWENLIWCLLGVTIGTMVGVLPGLGPMAAISLLLPWTYSIPSATTAIIFLAGIYYGTQYGGSITSILLRLPGETASMVTVIDGHAMTRNGRGGAALTVAALSSFFAGTVATFLIMLVAKPLSGIVLVFGPADYASLMVLGIMAASALSNQSYLKSLSMALMGMLLGLIGMDTNTGRERFTMDIPYLFDGIPFAIIAMGIFGIGEILYNMLHEPALRAKPAVPESIYPTKQEMQQSSMPAVRGTIIGSLMGVLPGGGALLSSMTAYVIEKKISKNPESFGQGNPAGVAAPEAANNAGAQTSFIPMLSLGIPITPIMALMISALMINGIQPGPGIIESNGSLFWGLIASMWIGNLFLLVLNLPLVFVWIKLLQIKWTVLYPTIMLACIFGAYSINQQWFDVGLLVFFAILGYVFKIVRCDPAPLAMGFILGVMFEEYLRRSLTISRGDWMIFLDRPISLSLLIIALLILLSGLFLRTKRRSTPDGL